MSGAQEQEKTQKEELFKNILLKASKMTPEEMQFSYKGILYPTLLCNEAAFQTLEAFEAREDDVLIVTYPKCGTNWTVHILQEMLLAVHNKEPTVDRGMLEFIFGTAEKYEHLKKQPSPRVLASHLTYDNIPKSFLEKTKILVILRNPKDTAVSYYHFTNSNPLMPTYSSWDLFFQDYISGNGEHAKPGILVSGIVPVIYGSYFDHVLSLEKHVNDGNILVLTFEDMKTDFPAEIRKIADFYGLSMTDEQIQHVQNKTSFKTMKENSSNTHGNIAGAFFRKGEIGDWKSLFTEEQSKEVDAKFEETLAGTKLGEKIDYKKYCTF